MTNYRIDTHRNEGPEFDHIDPQKRGRVMKLEFHGMNIGRMITGNVSCDHKPKKAPVHLILACCDEFVRSDRWFIFLPAAAR